MPSKRNVENDEPVVLRAAITKRVAQVTGYDKMVVEIVLVTALGVIAEELARGKRVNIYGFGSWYWKVWKGRTTWLADGNSKRRTLRTLPDRRHLHFALARRLKETIEGVVNGDGSRQPDEQRDAPRREQPVADPFANVRLPVKEVRAVQHRRGGERGE